jgi:DNA-binding LytR/AlgR family response regulator
MIKAIALDDEPLALQLMQQHCQQINTVQLLATFTNPDEAANFIYNNPVDLIFLDIQMPDISGLQFYKNLTQKPVVIFTTAFKEFAVEGFNVDAVDYLLKPFEHNRLQKAIAKAGDYIQFLQSKQPINEHIFIKVNYEMMKINIADIDLVEALDDYIKIYTKPTPVLTLMTMKSFTEKLPTQHFVRIHRSYIVPIKKVERFTKNKVYIVGKELPIGSSYADVYDVLMQGN